MAMKRIWGLEKIELSPLYFNSLCLMSALEALKKVRGKVLEIGCGAGAFTKAIKKYRPDLKLFGLDIDPELISLADKIDKDDSYIQADAQEIPFDDNSFNAVVAFDVIEHLNNPRLAFKEVFRVLKKDGVFHASIPLEKSNFTLHGWFLKLGIKPKKNYAGHIQQFKAKDILDILDITGFSKVKYKYSGHFIHQVVDFLYFFILSILKLKPPHTVEGYVEVMPDNVFKQLLHVLKTMISFLNFYESKFLKNVPGQIGHFTAYK